MENKKDDDQIMESIGKKIREKRKDKMLTQQELGEIIGKDQCSISSWEKGRKRPDVVDLAKMKNVINITI